MRRFEFVEGTSSKFWEIEQSGSSLTIKFGRIGSNGQTQLKSLDSDAAALKELTKLVAEKSKKGYVEVGGAPAGAAPAPAAAAAAPAAPPASVPAPRPAPKAAAPAPVPSAPEAAPVGPSLNASTPPSLEEENGVHWSDALRKRVFPRRGGIDVRIPVLPPIKRSWAALTKAWAARAKPLEEFLAKRVPLSEALAALKARMGDEPSAGTPAADALLVAVLAWSPDWQTTPEFDAPVEAFAALAGLPHAVRTQLLALDPATLKDAGIAPDWRSDFEGRGMLRGLPRLRELLVTAPEADYFAARDVAGEIRAGGTEAQRVAAAFLFPTERDWTAQLLAPSLDALHACILGGISDPALLVGLQPGGVTLFSGRWTQQTQDWAATLVDGCGIAAVSLLSTQAAGYSDSEMLRTFYGTLAALGCDEAMQALLDGLAHKEAQAALADASSRQPRRAMRLLAALGGQRGKAADPARSVLGNVVRRFPALVQEVLPGLSAEAAKVLEALRADAAQQAEDARPEDLPRVLRDPPWARKQKSAPPVVLASVPSVQVEDRVAFAPGEREDWAQRTGYGAVENTAAEWTALAGCIDRAHSAALLAACPPEHVAAVAPKTTMEKWNDDAWYPAIAAKHGLAALAFWEHRLTCDLAGALPFVVPLGVCRFGPLMAQALTAKKSLRADARAWLLRHPEHAAASLLPQALGKLGRARQDAQTALRTVAANGHEAAVFAVAERAGVKEPVVALLASDPLDLLPAKLPKLPAFVDPAALPRPLLASKQAAVPAGAMEALVTALALSPLDDPYAGIAQIREACDPASLSRCAWELFQLWLINGAPSKEVWCMNALGHFGDDGCARRLAALVREWPGEAAHARAVAGLDVLAAIGTDVALMHLNSIALKAKFKGLQGKAQEKIEAIAETRGLTREELEDRLAPDLGLDEDGSMLLDFGPRQFRVGFDEQLRPFVADAGGSRLKDLPKPKQSDDGPRATEAAARWGQLKKDARTSAGLQILRLELAMCGQRRFAAADFLELFVRHPLVFHVVRRLVWAVYDEQNRITQTFRVAEDRSLADAQENAWTLPEGAKVGIPHPLELDATVSGHWGQVLGDYELVQPFLQLGRPTFKVTEPEVKSRALDRVKGLKVPTGKVLGLEQRRWRRGAPQDGGVVCWMEKRLADRRLVVLDLDPGLYTGMLSESPEQTLGLCTVDSKNWSHNDGIPLGELDPIVFSELVNDLERLRG